MNILRCRAHTRQHIRDHSVDVDQLERMVISTVCKLNVVRKENERFILLYVIDLSVIYLCGRVSHSYIDSSRNI